MIVIREFLFTTVSVLILMLASCATGATPTETLGMPTPAATGAAGTDLPGGEQSPTEAPHVDRLAQEFLAAQLGVPVDEAVVVSSEAEEWTDSCLGLGGPAESCAAVITPGYRFILDVNGQEYEVRSDETGTAMRLAPPGNGGSPDTTQAPGAGGELENSAWILVSMGPPDGQLAALDGEPVTLQFEPGGAAGGNSGCNTYGGQYSVSGDTISFSNIVSTMMACVDQGRMDQEQTYITALQAAERFELSGDELRIFYNDDQGVLTFTAE